MNCIIQPRVLCFLSVFLLIAASATAQVQTPRYNTPINANTKGFYEYLPQGYGADNSTYPLIVFLAGKGALGNGDAATLPRVLNDGLAKLIKDGKFPVSFSVNGITHKFIIISPQFVAWQAPADVEAVINYAISHYRVNINRVYLTGMSMGGGGVWDYAGDNSSAANRLAAIVPVCGSSYPELVKGRIIAESNLPVWATHNSGDDVVPVYKTHGYVDYINQEPAPIPAAKKTIFDAIGHDAWTKTYDPAFRENGLNVYEWMLQYERTVLTAGSNSPVCYDSVLHLTAWNLEGATYSWSGPNGFSSGLREPMITPVTAAVAGTYTVTLTMGDSTATASTNVMVSIPGTFYRDADQDGYGTPSLTINACRAPRGYTARSGDCNDGNATIYPGAPELCDKLDNNCNGQIDEGLTVIRYYKDADGDGWGNATLYKDSCAQLLGYVMDNTDCNDNKASVYPGALEIMDGLDNDCNGKIDDNAVAGINVNVYGGTNPYTTSEWNNWNVNSSKTTTGLKYADGTTSTVKAVLSASSGISDNGATYGGGMAPAEVLRYTSYYTSSRTLTLSGLSTTKSYNLKLYASRNNTGNSTTFSIGGQSVNVVTDKNKVSAASFINLRTNTSGQVVISIAKTGTYNYLNGFVLTENPGTLAAAIPPTVNAGPDQTTTLPTNTASLNGSGSDADGSIFKYAWTKMAGPSQFTIDAPNSAYTTVSNLMEGTYTFRLTVTDNDGLLTYDNVVVYVNAAIPAGMKLIRVNVYGGSNAYSNTAWNNWNVSASKTVASLKYSDGTASSVGAVLSASSGISDNGSSYGGTMAPPEVLRYTSYSGSLRTLTINGLSTSQTYNLDLYASRNNTGNSSVFTVGSTTVTIVTDANKTNVASFTGLVPNSSGQIVVSLNKVGTYDYLNGFTLTQTNATSSVTSITSKQTLSFIQESTVPALQVQVFPNPTQQYFTLRLKSNSDKAIQLRIINAMGQEIQWRQGLSSNTTIQFGHNYRPGVYYAQVLQDGKMVTVKLIKQLY